MGDSLMAIDACLAGVQHVLMELPGLGGLLREDHVVDVMAVAALARIVGAHPGDFSVFHDLDVGHVFLGGIDYPGDLAPHLSAGLDLSPHLRQEFFWHVAV